MKSNSQLGGKMKRIIIYLLLLLMAGCSRNNSFDVDSSDKPECMNLENTSFSLYQFVAVTDKGYYYPSNNYLYYRDFSTGKKYYVCNKPNCLHREEKDQLIGQECNAYLSNASYGGLLKPGPFVYANGYLYAVQGSVDFQTNQFDGVDLIRIKKDGSDRQVLDHDDISISQIAVHYDSLFYLAADEFIYRIDLKDPSLQPKLLFENQPFQNLGFSLFCYKDHLYLSAGQYTDKEGALHHDVFVKIDLNTLEITVLKEDESSLYFMILDDGMYLYNHLGDTYLFNEKTGDNKYICDAAGQVNVTNDYIYVYNGPNRFMRFDSGKQLTVLDKTDCTEIDTVDLETIDDYIYSWPAGAFQNQILFCSKRSEESNASEFPSASKEIETLYSFYVENGKIEYRIVDQTSSTDNNFGGYYTHGD